MALFSNIIPFIRYYEGGYVDNPNDSGGSTMAGITWTTWQQFFGNTQTRFMTMSNADWGTIFKSGFWDPILGDQITSQRIADVLVDWCWGSGITYPVKNIQTILNDTFGNSLTIDGNFGPMTLSALNSANEPQLFNLIIKSHISYIVNIVTNNSTQLTFLDGWINRITDEVFFEFTGNLP